MHDPAVMFLEDLAIVLGTAAVTTVLFRKLKLPVALGYVLAGLLVGPSLPTGIEANRETIVTLSELGVTLLMFSVGLELSFRQLVRVGFSAFGTALIEVSFVVWLGYLAARGFGYSVREAIFVGAALGISSTMLVAKTVGGARDPELRPLVLGVLVAEDLFAILLLALLTPVASRSALTALQIASEAAKLLGFLGALVVLGIFIVPRFVRFVSQLESPETLLVSSIGLAFCAAAAATSAGYSAALGAFVVGALVAESGESAKIEPLVHPVRDVFAAIFLVSVGMQVDPAIAAQHPGLIALLVGVVLAGKWIAVTLGAVLTGRRLGVAMQAAVGLAQIGEFSFIIAALSLRLGAFGRALSATIVAASVVLAVVSTFAFRSAPRAVARIEGRLPEALRTWLTFYGTWIEDLRRAPPARNATVVRRALRSLVVDVVAICAVVVATSLLRHKATVFLQRFHLSREAALGSLLLAATFVILPFALGVLRNARRLGVELGARVLPLAENGKVDLAASPRRAFVVTLQLLVVWIVGLPVAALMQPFLPGATAAVVFIGGTIVLAVSFWRSATNLQGHVRAGAQVIVEAMRKQGRDEASSLDRVQSVLPGFGTLVSFRIADDARSIGRNLRELDLRGLTGATVLAIKRGDSGVVPGPEEILRSGDELVLAGTGEAIAAAKTLLA